MAVKWLNEPEAHDYQAAADYLSMLAEAERVEKTVAAFSDAKPMYRKAKDILRAARLALLPVTNPHVNPISPRSAPVRSCPRSCWSVARRSPRSHWR